MDILKGFEYRGIYASNDTNFYTYRIKEKRIGTIVCIEKYDSKTMEQVFAKEIQLPYNDGEVYSAEARGGCHTEVQFLNNTTIIIYSLFNDEQKANNVYAIRVDKEGNYTKPELLALITYSLQVRIKNILG